MKQGMVAVLVVMAALVCGPAFADTFIYGSSAVTNGGTYTSGQITGAGWLDRVEVQQDAGGTCTVVVASYDANGTAVDTFCTLSSQAGNKVVRPRFIGTTTAGVALTAALSDGTASNVTTQLTAAYERAWIGGNAKIKITGTASCDTTNAVQVTLFFSK